MSVRTVSSVARYESVAFAIDSPGRSRGAKTPDAAVETLEAYRGRYRPVARLAGLEPEFEAGGLLDVIEDSVGTGSTDFWGISFKGSSFEEGPTQQDELERKLLLLEASWRFFDDVAVRVSPAMRKGIRGGGRDRDEVVAHTFRTEADEFGRKIGVITRPGDMLTAEGLRTHREQFLAAVRAHNTEGRKAGRSWTLPFLVRHAAFHTLDHAWEMEDKDIS